MTKKLFVGGLSWGTNDEQLKAAFEAFGKVLSAKVILDAETGRSRGFGFVEYGEADAAQQAIAKMDGTELDGRTIRVNEAQEKQRRPRDDDRDARSSAPRSSAPRSDRPAASSSGPRRGPDKRRPGPPRTPDKGGDRFERRRNAAQGRRRRDGFDEGGSSDDFDGDF